ncbi:F-box domain containing protein [Colletotrichum kahawae]|uniref:F-box domain containing protein n=1 Tax=Colletotrichum kahawae TaxID=34407 RepID=A0AAD9YKX4_COLKA|nr:F-box domain containing protein [Colletotrichum kahawae]
MQRKRCQPSQSAGMDGWSPLPKRARLTASPHNAFKTQPVFAAGDLLSALSDEILVRILSCLSPSDLLRIAPVSRRFHRLSSDSQLWRTLYYHRFVLPRALRIPGFRDGSARESAKVHYSSRRTVWADGGWGRRGGSGESVDWKRQYKLRHNWARGTATVEELNVRDTSPRYSLRSKTLAKVTEGIAVTADGFSGLRAWDLKTRESIAQIGLNDGNDKPTPTCIAVDDQALDLRRLGVVIGFLDGSFGVWQLHLEEGRFLRRYKHEKSTNGKLIEITYRHPYVLTATESVLISLYNFQQPSPKPTSEHGRQEKETSPDESETEAGSESATLRESEGEMEQYIPKKSLSSKAADSRAERRAVVSLQAPVLMTSLKSHSSRAPLALSIRQTASSTIASIAYTYSTREGWSIGIQDLHIRRHGVGGLSTPEVTSTRLAFTTSITASCSASMGSRRDDSNTQAPIVQVECGPTALSYNHPYLLAATADNTLVLHVCTSNATNLSVSPGIRLWGHTSGISDAEITARGKAVSVSSRGEEIRVWELEGRVSGKSIEVRPNSITNDTFMSTYGPWSESKSGGWNDRRSWVGFDDEMVLVLKETRDGRETLMMYDFS